MPTIADEYVLRIFLIASLLVVFLLVFVVIVLFLHRQKQQNFTIELEKIRTNFEKELLKTQLEIQEQTFQYISQEIHDNIGQFISLAKLHLNTLNFSNPDQTTKQIRNSVDLLTRALDDLRDLSKSLSSDIIRNGGLIRAIELQIGQLRKLEKPEVTCEINGDYQFLDEQREIFILRILQEAINNIIRHSEAGKIEVILSYLHNSLSLSIRDNGKGFDVQGCQVSDTSGVNNMRKRAKMIDAVFSIKSQPGSGTIVNILIPY